MTNLRPTEGSSFLTVAEVVCRATEEFAFVQCDSSRGVRYAAERLAKTSRSVSHDAKDRAMAMMMDTVEMILGDNRRTDKHFLKCVVIPNEPIEVLYLYDTHQANTLSLLVRLSKALGYTIAND